MWVWPRQWEGSQPPKGTVLSAAASLREPFQAVYFRGEDDLHPGDATTRGQASQT